MTTVRLNVVVCTTEGCPRRDELRVLTPGAGALACECNRVYTPVQTVTCDWLPGEGRLLGNDGETAVM